jgi:hypothetical protein
MYFPLGASISTFRKLHFMQRSEMGTKVRCLMMQIFDGLDDSREENRVKFPLILSFSGVRRLQLTIPGSHPARD